MTSNRRWSGWREFPNPTRCELLVAPFGPGCYELRHTKGKLILFGSGCNVASRMSSLLPEPYGCGVRHNEEKREYIWKNIAAVEYRTLACATCEEARQQEKELKANRTAYIFPT